MATPRGSPTLEQTLTEALGGYVSPFRQPSRRVDATWLAGAMMVLILVATLPLNFLCMSILTLAAVATCLRAFALHQYTQRLSELAAHAGTGQGGDSASASGSGGAAAGALSSAAQRRPRRPSLLTAVAAAGRPFNLLHLRLSLVERDFTEPGDYELLLRLDELEAGAAQESAQQQQPPSLPESQLALLPVHVHHTPTRKERKQRSTPFDLTPRAATSTGAAQHDTPAQASSRNNTPTTSQISSSSSSRDSLSRWKPSPATSAAAAGGSSHKVQRFAAGGPPLVPVLQEQLQQQAVVPAPSGPRQSSSSSSTSSSSAGSFSSVGGLGAAAAPASAQPLGAVASELEIVPATPPAEAAAVLSEGGESERETVCSEEDEEILCSVCLEPFDDGAKIVSLPCGHQYHEECVKTWLRYKGIDATCPNCKGQVFDSPEEAEEQQQS